MPERFSYRVEQAENASILTFAGLIDQAGTAAFEELSSATLKPLIEISFRGVTRINSYGIGLLMKFLGRRSRDHRIEYWECPEVIVDQFQMLDFSRYGRIRSFFVRYRCETCFHEELRLLNTGDVRAEGSEVFAPVFPCTCGQKQEVDELLDFLLDHL